MESELAAGTSAKLAQDGEQINEDVTAKLAQENAQATAVGNSPDAQYSPLTSDIDASTFYQPNLDNLPLPQLPHIVGSEGAQG